MGFATLLSRVLGLVREQAFAYLFGAGNAMDAFNVAFRIPNLLRNLFAEGAMSASLVPVFTRARHEAGERAAWRVAGLTFRALAAAVTLIAVLGILFAPQLVHLYAGAFERVAGKYELTVRMTRIMFPFFPMVAVAAAFMGVLNACGYFFVPALSSALFNVGAIGAGVGLATYFTGLRGAELGFFPIEGMAIGVLAGGLVQLLSQLPALYGAGYRWPRKAPEDPAWRRDPDLRRMIAMMLPGVAGLAATQVSILVNTILATSQGAGAVSWLNYAFRLMQFPIGLFGASFAAAVLPQVSRQWVQRDVRGVAGTLEHGLKQVFAINLPASAGLAFLGYPIIELIFQYGRFYSEDTRQTALALAMYALGLTAYSAVKVLVPASYAMGNTRVPVLASAVSVLCTIVLNVVLVRVWGFWALALGTSISAILNAAILMSAVGRMVEAAGGRFPRGELARSFLRCLCVALTMGTLCFFSHQLLNSWLPDKILVSGLGSKGLPLSRGLKMATVTLEGAVFTWFVARKLGFGEMTEAADLFAQKLKKRLRRAST